MIERKKYVRLSKEPEQRYRANRENTEETNVLVHRMRAGVQWGGRPESQNGANCVMTRTPG